MDIISSLLSGRLVREKVGPAVQSAVQSQVFNTNHSIQCSNNFIPKVLNNNKHFFLLKYWR
jgi:hypothetical protein